jgi:hypothetical protein
LAGSVLAGCVEAARAGCCGAAVLTAPITKMAPASKADVIGHRRMGVT